MLLSIKDFLLKTAVFLRLVDGHDGQLSITNIAMFVVLYKLFTVEAASINDLGALLVTLGAYNYKKFLNQDRTAE